jgi:hypothetical protein
MTRRAVAYIDRILKDTISRRKSQIANLIGLWFRHRSPNLPRA